jgi:hypothetical protein
MTRIISCDRIRALESVLNIPRNPTTSLFDAATSDMSGNPVLGAVGVLSLALG